jgi:ATP-binding cassette, subfamily F, member 3
LISVQGISKFVGKTEIFKDVSFSIQDGERVGLIGRNGVGKTTLVQILLGEVEPDSGVVSIPRHLVLAGLPQQVVHVSGSTVLAYALDISARLRRVQEALIQVQQNLDSEKEPERCRRLAFQHAHLLEQYEHLGGYDMESRAREILAGLGFSQKQLGSPVSALSGGWAMRLALARLLLSAPDALLLDEPTNHLDLDSLLWLEEYLLSARQCMIIISHDRAFLNRLVTRILELERGRLTDFSGNYDYYLEEKARRHEIQLAAFRNQQQRVQQLERFIARNRYRKDRARQAQSRLKVMARMELLQVPAGEISFEFAFPEPPPCGKRVLEMHDVAKRYDDLTVCEGVDLVMERGDRIAILGSNGAGKSTLLKMMAGIEPPSEGQIRMGHKVARGYYAQHQMEQLNESLTVMQEASKIAGDLTLTQVRGLLGAFLFRGDDVEKRVAVLSGGEKARLALCKLLMQRPNLLLLDEPTNHLDIPARDVFEEALESYNGTICFISHDRHFIDAIATKMVYVRNGAIQLFPGNYSDFQQIWRQRLEADRELSSGNVRLAQHTERSAPTATRKDQDRKRQEAEWRNEFHRLKRPMQIRLEQLESELEDTQKQLASYSEKLADPATYQSGADVGELQREYSRLQRNLQDLTAQWEEQALTLEDLEQSFWENRRGAGAAQTTTLC